MVSARHNRYGRSIHSRDTWGCIQIQDFSVRVAVAMAAQALKVVVNFWVVVAAAVLHLAPVITMTLSPSRFLWVGPAGRSSKS